MRCRLFRKIIPERKKEDVARVVVVGISIEVCYAALVSRRVAHLEDHTHRYFPLLPWKNKFGHAPIGGASYSAKNKCRSTVRR
ncbi:hypothetical protein MTP99_000764 [Tenebrio molitor]|nr:hypothetical protein MTP99_000764 [Tenebrio molitor]